MQIYTWAIAFRDFTYQVVISSLMTFVSLSLQIFCMFQCIGFLIGLFNGSGNVDQVTKTMHMSYDLFMLIMPLIAIPSFIHGLGFPDELKKVYENPIQTEYEKQMKYVVDCFKAHDKKKEEKIAPTSFGATIPFGMVPNAFGEVKE